MGALSTIAKSVTKSYKTVAKLRARISDAKAQGKRDLATSIQTELDKVTSNINASKKKMLDTKKPGKILTLGAKKSKRAQATLKKGADVAKKASLAKITARKNALVDSNIDKTKRKIKNIGTAHRKLLESNFDTRSPKIVVDVTNKNDEVVEELQALQALRDSPKAMKSVKLPEKPKVKSAPQPKRKLPKVIKSFSSKRSK